MKLPPGVRLKKEKIDTGSEQTVLNIVKDTGWLEDYMTVAMNYSDSPAAYHMAAGLVLLATFAVGIEIPAWGHAMKPNLWIMLVSPSGTLKTGALNIAHLVTLRAGKERLLPQDPTWPRLVAKLKENVSGIHILNELARWIELLGQKWNRGQLWGLMELFDSPPSWELARVGQGSGTMIRPSYNAIYGTTIRVFETHGKVEHFAGGFYGRHMILTAKRERRQGYRGRIPEFKLDNLAQGLKTISQLQGEMNLFDIDEAFDNWFRSKRHQWPKLFEGLASRHEPYVMKLASLLRLSKSYGKDRTVTEWEFWRATLIAELHRASCNALAKTVTLMRPGPKYEVRRLIEEHPGIIQQELCAAVPLVKRQLTEILETIQYEGTGYSKHEKIEGQDLIRWYPVTKEEEE